MVCESGYVFVNDMLDVVRFCIPPPHWFPIPEKGGHNRDFAVVFQFQHGRVAAQVYAITNYLLFFTLSHVLNCQIFC